MLTYLAFENIALVERAELQFERGMTVLTGETGAGKSIIVTALALALGGRAEREYIRHASDQATVTAAFKVGHLSTAFKRKFADCIADNSIMVSREIQRDGNSKVRINGTVASLNRLKEVTEPLAEILGQHANQLLLNESNHLGFLDRFASLESLREELAALYEQWQRAAAELRRVSTRREQLVNERELLLFQKAEIEKGQVRVGEEEELLRERRILDSARALMASSALVQQALDNEEGAALQQFRLARKELEKMTLVDPSLEPRVAELTDLEFRTEEFRGFIEQYGSSIADDPARLEEINGRLDEIYVLKKKYGGSEEGVLATLRTISDRLLQFPDTDQLIEGLEFKTEQTKSEYTSKALQLSALRRRGAEYLKRLAVKELAELAIEGAGFEFELVYQDDPAGVIMDGRAVRPFSYGLESGRILFSANKGEPLKSLVKTASGGEISRLLLALKGAEKRGGRLQQSLLVFDEVDAGIGGQTAVEVGRKLKKLSEECQLLVITHLHQIARCADRHYVAEKSARSGGRATITVRPLDSGGIAQELERMIALPGKK